MIDPLSPLFLEHRMIDVQFNIKSVVIGLALGVCLLAFGVADASAQTGNVVKLKVGRSTVIQAPWPVKTISVAEPAVAEVQIAAINQVIVLGVKPGSTDVVLWDDDGQVWQTQVIVEGTEEDVMKLQDELNGLFPNSDLRVSKANEILVVKGAFRRSEEVGHLKTYLDGLGGKYLNMTRLEGVQQVQLNVRVAEASRQATRALGVNVLHAGNSFFGGSVVGGNPNGINIGVPGGTPAAHNLPFVFQNSTTIGSAVTLFAGFPDADLQFFIQALEENQYLKTLAEPSLVALSGENASFLAGGEFPVPIAQSSGGSGSSSITVEFKEFGVRLNFKPDVLGDGSIRLYVAPEVSQLSDIGSVRVADFVIPSLSVRRSETTLEMKDGQTFAMAGLIDEFTRSSSTKVPVLGDLPILGPMFRSVQYINGETELVILVTASLVEPLSTAENRPLPGMLHRPPSDWQLYAEALLESDEPMVLKPLGAKKVQQLGLDRLQGPGAWADHYDRSRTGPNARVKTYTP
jgi:pilus assembly protein CpaC